MEVVQKGCAALFLAALVGAQTELAPNALCSPQDLGAWANLEVNHTPLTCASLGVDSEEPVW